MFCNVASKSSNDLMFIITTLHNHTAATCHPISKTRSGVEAITWLLVDTAILNTAGKINMGFSFKALTIIAFSD